MRTIKYLQFIGCKHDSAKRASIEIKTIGKATVIARERLLEPINTVHQSTLKQAFSRNTK